MRLTLVGLVFASLAACGYRHGSSPPNVILISLDTLRADHVGCYGYPRPTTPAIDAVASDGTVFERAVATSPWTLPSHASMVTGLQPRHHGARSQETGLPGSIPTLATTLAGLGYQTMAIVNNTFLTPKFGLTRGFDAFRHFPEAFEGRRVRSAKAQVDLAIEWIGKVREDSFFLFLHNYDIHSDYDPSPQFAARFTHPYSGTMTGSTRDLLRVRRGEIDLTEDDVRHVVDLYDAGICEVDRELGRFLDYLRDLGILDQTILIITADHGEEFLEHGGVLHGRTMHRELLDVPLIMRGPGVAEGRRVRELVQVSDIFPTVVAMLSLEPEHATDGESLVNTWTADRGDGPGRRAYAEADHNREIGNDTLEMVQTDRFKLVFERPTHTVYLYDCRADPGEQVDVASQHPEVAEDLLGNLLDLDASRRPGSPLSPLANTEREALRALGYLP